MRFTLEVRESSIHGLGVFAASDIPPGAAIGLYEGDVTDENGTHVLWVEQDDGSELGIDGRNDLRYLNHSAAPNCEFDGPELYSLISISPGQELTFHYGDDWDAGVPDELAQADADLVLGDEP